MRVLKLHHPTGHPYWNKNEFKVELPSGKFFDLMPIYHYQPKSTGYEIYVENGDVFFQECGCGSGTGKNRLSHIKPVKIVSKEEYDVLEYVGEELTMSRELLEDLKDNQLL